MAKYNLYEALTQEEANLETFSLLKYVKKPNGEVELQDVYFSFIPTIEIAGATVDDWTKNIKKNLKIYKKLQEFGIPIWWIAYLYESFLDGVYIAWQDYMKVIEIEILRDHGDMEMDIKLYEYDEDCYVVYPVHISYMVYGGLEASMGSEYTVPLWAVTKVVEGGKV